MNDAAGGANAGASITHGMNFKAAIFCLKRFSFCWNLRYVTPVETLAATDANTNKTERNAPYHIDL